ncbi:MAG: stage V sporulation protein AD [Ruminococcaceae bacterium]|nr:stage V sporulation protein AD [Oscillospiraceae bacterium]
MTKKIGTGTYKFQTPVEVSAFSSIVGQKEKEGPLGKYFHKYSNDEYFKQDSFEKAESFMQKEVLNDVIQQEKISPQDIEFIFAGDLLNQCAGSNFSVRDTPVQFFGLYGACSTMAEGTILAAMTVDGGFANRAIALTSSHFCSAERQFRFPLEYGNQRTPTSQWTVTGSGCVMLSKENDANKPKIKDCCPGVVCDMGITDMNNMGAAMAPAAALTLKRYLDDTKTKPEDYDLIVTGDLGSQGKELLRILLKKDGITLGKEYDDCGTMIYDCEKQDVHAGGSGCGCSASVLTGYILPKMMQMRYKEVLFMTTGALMNPNTSLQGESIPGIAHLVHFSMN